MLRRFALVTVLAILPAAALRAQDPTGDADSSKVTLDRIFNSDFFSGQYVPPIRWTPDGEAYYSYDRREGAKGPDLVRVDPLTSARTVLVMAAMPLENTRHAPAPSRDASLRSADSTVGLLQRV